MYPPSIYAECNVDGTDFLLAFLRNDGFNEYITFAFDSPVTSWGADVGPGGYNSRRIDFTTNGGDGGYYITPASGYDDEFRGFVASNPFTLVTFTVSSGFTAQGWDNFGAHSIPEPTTVALLCLGAAGLLARRRCW
ncbi:MAG: PEP-CTERM sorting domain-containing protein [bacterium]